MKHSRVLASIGLLSCLAMFSTNANAAKASGTVVFNITGTFKTPVTNEASVQCNGILDLLQNVSDSTTLCSLSIAALFKRWGAKCGCVCDDQFPNKLFVHCYCPLPLG
jgi:hypothetical protein